MNKTFVPAANRTSLNGAAVSTDVPTGFTEAQRDQPGGFAADPDVMDTWATSSLTPQIAGKWEDDPDLFARVVPILRSMLRRGPADPRVSGLRRRSRIVVTSWVLIVVPLLTVGLGDLILHLPQINRALWQSVRQQAYSAVLDQFQRAATTGISTLV